MRLGSSEYEPPDKSWSREHARAIFWLCIREHAPDDWRELQDKCSQTHYELFRAFVQERNPYLYTGSEGKISVISSAIPILVDFRKYLSVKLGFSSEQAWVDKPPSSKMGHVVSYVLPEGTPLFIMMTSGETHADMERMLSYSAEKELEKAEVQFRTEPIDLSESDIKARLNTLQQELTAWAKRKNLSEIWCITYVLEALTTWSIYAAFEHLPLPYKVSARTPLVDNEKRRFIFEHLGWDLMSKTKTEIKNEMREAFNAQLDSYFEKMDSVIEQNGYVQTPEKFSVDHFTWLVLFQVRGLSKSEIARQCNATRTAVIAGINNAASLIELPMRDSDS